MADLVSRVRRFLSHYLLVRPFARERLFVFLASAADVRWFVGNEIETGLAVL